MSRRERDNTDKSKVKKGEIPLTLSRARHECVVAKTTAELTASFVKILREELDTGGFDRERLTAAAQARLMEAEEAAAAAAAKAEEEEESKSIRRSQR